MQAIHQFVAGFSKGDAISNEALVFRELFRAWGHESHIFSETRRILPELRSQAQDISRTQELVKDEDIVLLHLSIGSVVNEHFAQLRGRKVILYHNITPAHYFRGIQEEVALNLARGRQQAERLAGTAEIHLADSAYNADEFQQMGCPKVDVLPLILNFNKLREGFDRRQHAEFADGRKNVLFVGRVAPNKQIEDVLYAFHYYQKNVEPESRLILAGSYSGMESYYAYLLTVQRELKLRQVFFTGSIPQTWLNACYKAADLFVCMSEHEGFCIPVIEAMAMGVPVLAYAAAAVPETMDGAGVLFADKNYHRIAELMGSMVQDMALRQSVLQRQAERIARYEGRDLASELRGHLAPLLNQ
jgi:glycosyltransferase involved in cell wall biosynthesis